LATEYLDLDDAFDGYAEAVEVSVEQAKDALLNLGQLESALARPQNAAVYEDADNKRTAVVLLRSFLNLNGHDLTLSDDERFDLALSVAAAHASLDEVEAQLRPGIVAL
jgi:prophage maintenance system killer protein